MFPSSPWAQSIPLLSIRDDHEFHTLGNGRYSVLWFFLAWPERTKFNFLSDAILRIGVRWRCLKFASLKFDPVVLVTAELLKYGPYCGNEKMTL